MALCCAAIETDVVEVALRHKPAALLALSPKGTVPVLQLPDGSVIDQSLDIMHWALGQHDPEGWLTQRNANESAEAAQWITSNDALFKPLLDRYKYAERHPELTKPAHRDAAVQAFIQPLDQQLRSQAFVLGGRASLADVALFPFVRQFAGVDAAWFATAALPGLQVWLAHWLQSPWFTRVMALPLPTPTPGAGQ